MQLDGEISFPRLLLTCDAGVVAEASEPIFRNDLQDVHGFGRCGFHIAIPPTVSAEDFATLAVIEQASGAAIDASSAKVVMRYGGRVEHCSAFLVTGYVFDSRPRLTLPGVSLVHAGVVIASCTPSFVRRDMAHVLNTEQVWQFSLSIPASLRPQLEQASLEFDGEAGYFQTVAPNARSDKVTRLAAHCIDAAWYQSRRECSTFDFSLMPALEHFLAVGYYQGLSPTPLFDAAWYTTTVPGLPEAIATGQIVSAFQHYIDHGMASSLDPHPLISYEYLAETVADFTPDPDAGVIADILGGRLPTAAVNPLVSDSAQRWARELADLRDQAATASASFRLDSIEYLYFAMVRDRSPPSPRYFDVDWYVARNLIPGLGARDGFGAVSHYFRVGRRAGADTHPLVSTAYFMRRQGSETPEMAAKHGLLSILLAADPQAIGLNPFIPAGHAAAGSDALPASPYIDDAWYFSNNPVANSAREMGLVGSALEHLTRAPDRDIAAPHPLFAREWYLARHPDAAAAIASGCSPNAFAYFMEFGQHAGHDPHPAFDSAWYCEHWLVGRRHEASDGVPGSIRPKQTAFEYFHSTGLRLNRFPSPYFYPESDPGLYGSPSHASAGAGQDGEGLARFVAFANGWHSRDFRPNTIFDPAYYAECARKLGMRVAHMQNAFQHYLQVGASAGIEPNAFFNSIWYMHCHMPEGASPGDAFRHYCVAGNRTGRSPNPLFDEDYYRFTYADVERDIGQKRSISGFAHYCRVGWQENRRTHPYLSLPEMPKADIEASAGRRGNLDLYIGQVKAGSRPIPDIGRIFDEDWYTTAYPEVADETASFNLPTGFAHYLQIGIHRQRSPGPLFDEAFYLRAHPDLGQAWRNGKIPSGYAHFHDTRREDRAWHPLLTFRTLLNSIPGDLTLDFAPLPARRELVDGQHDIAATAFTTIAAEFQYWRSVCAANPANYFAAMQLVSSAAQMNDRQAIDEWLPAARAGKPEPWRSLAISLVEKCFSIGDCGIAQARLAFSAMFKHTKPIFIIDKPFPREVACGRSTAVSIDCVCFHPLYETVAVEICIGQRSIPLSPERTIRHDVDERNRDFDLLGHSLYSGINSYIIVDDFEPGVTASVAYRLRVRDASGVDQIFFVEAGEVTFLPRPEIISPQPGSAGDQRRIAVCMATFEPDLELFARQVNSIRQQQYPAWTLFISDDGSSANAVRGMLREIGGDPRIVFQANQDRVGFCKNFERAISLAGPSYDAFALCDQDDEWFPDKLTVLDAALRDDVLLAYSDMEVCARDRTTLSHSFWTSRTSYCDDINEVLVANSVTGAASLFHRRVLELAMPFPDLSGLYHDHWLALCALVIGKIDFIPTPLHRYVQHEQNVLGFASSVKSALKRTHFRRRYLEMRQLGRKPVSELTRSDLSALINAAAIHRETTRLQAIVATIAGRVAAAGADGSGTASMAALWMQDGQFPAAAALAHTRRQGDAGVRKTLGAEYRLATSMIAANALQRGRQQVVSRVLQFGVATLRSRVVSEDASLRTLSSINAVTWRDHLRSKIRPLALSAEPAAEPSLRVNVLIPELTLSVFFGGYLGKFHLIRKLVDRGFAVRVITLDHYKQDIATIAGIEEKYPEFVGLFSRIEIIDRYDRTESVPVHRNDMFLATTWWSAHVAEDARKRTGKAEFFYLIQEFEPLTFAMGSWYATALQSYSFPHRALFSTALLQEYFKAEQLGVFSADRGGRALSCSFSNAIVDGASYPAAAETGEGRAKTMRRVLFYARPETHASRNMFEMGIASLIVAIQQGVFPLDEWEFVGIGSASPDFELHGGASLRMVGKMGLDEYYRFLQTVDVGLALMFTPHPSLVPLDMASFGVATVTNTCMNKDDAALRAISSNLIPTPPTIDGIVGGLRAARDLAQEQPRPERVGRVHWAMTWDDALNHAVMDFVAQSLRELGQAPGQGALPEPVPAAPRPVLRGKRPRIAAQGKSG